MSLPSLKMICEKLQTWETGLGSIPILQFQFQFRHFQILQFQFQFHNFIGRAVPLLKPPQSPHCWTGKDDHAKLPPYPPPPTPPLAILPVLKVILEMAFSAHCTKIWKLNWISMTIISKVAQECIWCCHQVQWCMTLPTAGGNCALRLESVVKITTSACPPYGLQFQFQNLPFQFQFRSPSGTSIPCQYMYIVLSLNKWQNEGFDNCDRPSNLTQIGFKSSIFLPVWPWNLMDNLEKTTGHLFNTTSSFVHHFKSISEFKLELQSRNAQLEWKSAIFVLK